MSLNFKKAGFHLFCILAQVKCGFGECLFHAQGHVKDILIKGICNTKTTTIPHAKTVQPLVLKCYIDPYIQQLTTHCVQLLYKREP